MITNGSKITAVVEKWQNTPEGKKNTVEGIAQALGVPVQDVIGALKRSGHYNGMSDSEIKKSLKVGETLVLKNGKVMTEEEAKGIDWGEIGKNLWKSISEGVQGWWKGLSGDTTFHYFTKISVTNGNPQICYILNKGEGWEPYGVQDNDKAATLPFASYLARVIDDWHKRHPNDPIRINDISRPGGGPFPPHKTHQTGESVDIKFMTTDGKAPAPGAYYECRTYDRQKTEEFLILAIQSVPEGWELRQVNFNDESIIEKYKNIYTNSLGRPIIRYAPGHDDHIDFQYRRK
ncbi:penicillin-insensitive murein endopeptidase [Thermospira aquatica]|uniref:Penicillin-insensitive murein endopeptidase n=1 Tax=Thermospira aquatica TaxID=2828656 RepID=A0AAX3BEE1_9SPIR|nr:penicillin-insensitive murein endopeptidase [Thermospira aquatica]URA10586.1 penicillin-insensitive murein endopeptidase [Thermospira aquatica]